MTQNQLKSHLLGMKKDIALKFLSENKINFRISREDEMPYLLTQDVKFDRYNLNIQKGLVAAVTTG